MNLFVIQQAVPPPFPRLLAGLACLLVIAAAPAWPDSARAGLPRRQEQVDPPSKYVSSKAYYHYLMGRIAGYEGRTGDAIEHFRQAIMYEPSTGALHVALGEQYLIKGKFQQAHEEAAEAISVQPELADAHMLAGRICVHERDFARAIPYFQRVISLEPAKPRGYDWLAISHLMLGDEEQSASVYRSFIAASPGAIDGYLKLADFYFNTGEHREAEVWYREALKRDPHNSGALAMISDIQEYRGDFAAAIATNETILRNDGASVERLGAMARLYLRRNSPKEAALYLEQIRNQGLGDVAHDYIARLYAQQGMYGEAARELNTLLGLSPDRHESRVFLGYVLMRASRFEEAARELEKVPRDAAEYRDARVQLAWNWSQAKEYGRALAVISASLPHLTSPAERGELLDTMASVLAEAGRYPEAAKLLEEQLETVQDPKLRESMLYNLGGVYFKMDRINDAFETMNKILGINPDNHHALNFIGYSYVERDEKLDQAEKYVRAALRLRPYEGYITDSLGWLLYKLGKYEKAAEYLLRATLMSPREPVIIDHYADALMKLGQQSRALELYREALKHNPEEKVRKAILDKIRALEKKRGRK
ncbi:MAG: Beta-barrel assembly-enhancing protease [Myxococcota bacterium]|nr:Beta-barrel assembly-enhancing protease [Myxococcota bacterium]